MAQGLAKSLQPGDEIVLSVAEHHANLVPWQMLSQRSGAQLRFIDETLCAVELAANLTEKTRIVSLSAASNVLGKTLDVRAIREVLQGRNVVWVLDASQLLAHHDIDVHDLGCDFLVASAHKFYGPMGVGFLWGKFPLLEQLSPLKGGGEMIETVGLYESSYRAAPGKFETGTANLPAIAGVRAALNFLRQQDRHAMRSHEATLLAQLYRALGDVEGVRVLSPADADCGLLSFSLESSSGLRCNELAHWLDEHDIAVRAGQMCTQPLLSALGVQDVLRISVCAYNSAGDIARVVAAIREALQQLDATDTHASDECLVGDASLQALLDERVWQRRYRLLMRYGDALNTDGFTRTDDSRVSGCESPAWIQMHLHDGVVIYRGDSDSRLVRGLIVIIMLALNGLAPSAVASYDFEGLMVQLGLVKHLSTSRSNGFRALLNRAVLLARG